MDDIANLDQAMKLIWERVRKENPDVNPDKLIIRAMKEAYRLGLGHAEMATIRAIVNE